VTKTESSLIKTPLNKEHRAGFEGFGYLVSLLLAVAVEVRGT